MKYIVPLGNPGEKYQNTRHNVGWLAMDAGIEAFGLPSLIENKKASGRVTEGQIGGQSVTVLYPDTFMNNSGSAVVKLMSKNDASDLVVIHDDIDLPFGEVKIGKGKGAGGNNGVQSIIQKLGSKDFVRVRIGIAPRSFWTGEVKRPKGGGPLERFVLKDFSRSEQKQLPEVYKKVQTALGLIVADGVETAMNKVN